MRSSDTQAAFLEAVNRAEVSDLIFWYGMW